mgnify:CR=1 FL=1
MDCRLFKGIPKARLTPVLAMFQQRRVYKDQIFIQEGQPGDEMYIIFKGTANVKAGPKVLAELGPGAVIGEICLINPGAKRTASVIATSDMVLYGVNTAVFHQIFKLDKDVAYKMLWNAYEITAERFAQILSSYEAVEEKHRVVLRERDDLQEELMESTKSGLRRIGESLRLVNPG